MFPEININDVEDLQDNKNSYGKTYLFDFDKGEFVVKDGKLVEASELEACEIWIRKIILTEKFKFKIYEKEDDEEYGVTIYKLIGKKLPKEMIKSEIKREFNKVLTKHPLIEKIKDIEINMDGVKTNIKFKVVLVNDEFNQEVIVSGN